MRAVMLTRPLTKADFAADSHAAKYQGELDAHSEAFGRLVAILNDPANEQRLIDAEAHGLPALAGVVRLVEAEPSIAEVLATGTDSTRFRQTVGVAVKLKMAKLGWTTTGRKGTVKGGTHFTKAEHYVSQPGFPADYTRRALGALEAVDQIGDEDERKETGLVLMTGLATTRSEEGRVF